MDVKSEKTVPEMLSDIAEAICNDYCKFRDQVRSQAKDIDMAEDMLLKSYCDSCPLQRMT